MSARRGTANRAQSAIGLIVFCAITATVRVWRNRQTRWFQKPVPKRSIGSTPIIRTSAKLTGESFDIRPEEVPDRICQAHGGGLRAARLP